MFDLEPILFPAFRDTETDEVVPINAYVERVGYLECLEHWVRQIIVRTVGVNKEALPNGYACAEMLSTNAGVFAAASIQDYIKDVSLPFQVLASEDLQPGQTLVVPAAAGSSGRIYLNLDELFTTLEIANGVNVIAQMTMAVEQGANELLLTKLNACCFHDLIAFSQFTPNVFAHLRLTLRKYKSVDSALITTPKVLLDFLSNCGDDGPFQMKKPTTENKAAFGVISDTPVYVIEPQANDTKPHADLFVLARPRDTGVCGYSSDFISFYSVLSNRNKPAVCVNIRLCLWADDRGVVKGMLI